MSDRIRFGMLYKDSSSEKYKNGISRTEIISGLSLHTLIWNRADLKDLNIRDQHFVRELEQILLKEGRVVFNNLAEVKIDIRNVHTMVADLQSTQKSVHALNDSLAMVCLEQDLS